MNLSIGRVIKMGLAGAAGGLVTYLLYDPGMRQLERHQLRLESLESVLTAMLVEVAKLGVTIGALIGMALVLAEEIETRRAGRILTRSLLGAAAGAAFGLIGAVVAQIVFMVIGNIHVVIGRTVGWAVMGAAAGLCPGSVAKAARRMRQGVLGGLIGGGIGGLLFDALSDLTQGGSTSRLVGFVVMGAAIGAAVSLVEEFGKEFWLVGLTGSKEGRSLILAKPITILGRDERADVPLFGDLTVQPQHALLRRDNGVMTLLAAPGQVVTINQQIVAEAPLADGDIMGIGRHRFRFRARRAAQPSSLYPPMPASPETLIYRQPTAPPPTFLPGMPLTGPVAGREISRLEILSGPHTGEAYPLTPGAILGRDLRCDIPLLRDSTISRQHLRFVREADGWRLEDGGSANGTFVNGQRVVMQPLVQGDQIRVGATQMRVL